MKNLITLDSNQINTQSIVKNYIKAYSLNVSNLNNTYTKYVNNTIINSLLYEKEINRIVLTFKHLPLTEELEIHLTKGLNKSKINYVVKSGRLVLKEMP